MSTQHPRVFAIALKNYVEIRSSPKPPKVEVSEVNKELVTQTPDFDQYNSLYNTWSQEFYERLRGDPNYRNFAAPPPGVPMKLGKRKFKIKVINHEGGRVLKVMKTDKFRRITGLGIRIGQMIEIPWSIGEQFVNPRVSQPSE